MGLGYIGSEYHIEEYKAGNQYQAKCSLNISRDNNCASDHDIDCVEVWSPTTGPVIPYCPSK